MNSFILLLLMLIQIYSYILVLRIIVEMIHSFSRNFRPPRWFAYVAEPLFVLTDPPVKALRRVIPPLRMGNVALDMSIIVLFLILWLARIVLGMLLVG
ncbi:YggT family protein [Corynebacterium pygosceleis]|uniref:YggT family protein n=1 Tax=Corynebacterium pygosceleis TaxID=2800406 RepID=A0A9Q4C6N6_9CORY|nr:YggT family protein [Corynebacterium pygosceleis]MCK7636656.1 YggT family protein [Corynebacterium pygosceleis]MCK7675230.1 YggT family protein [Corynebacterium pygosceleis]MCL0120555.1 YggT family protein [Corynebacterium pygosceleis]MCX7444106.1 YggT family protein [Corynebacterium pygosceleis]MCX7467409.1 YggT family protein [Corynebacterium pygosceleis]